MDSEKKPQWFIEHEALDRNEFQTARNDRQILHNELQNRPTKDEMKSIVHEALLEFFATKGILTKNIIVTTAVIIGALVVIGGGFKWLLGLIGFSYISK
jgi:hypothetical protein